LSQAPQNQPRQTFFEFREEARAFARSFSAMIQARVREGQPIPEQNVFHYTHGRTWDHPQSSGEGEMQTLSAEMEVGFADLMGGRLEAFPETVEHVSEQMRSHFFRMMYDTISEGAAKVGNVVSALDAGSFAAGFMEALRKIEFGVDRDGNVRMPEFHVGPNVAERFMAELESQPPEFKAEVERLKQEKFEAALKREQERKNRFVISPQ